VWRAKAILGEGPCWDARSDEVFWVDIKGERLHAYGVREKRQRTWAPPHRIFSLDAPPSSWAPPAAKAQWFVGCTAAGFGWIGVAGDDILIEALSHPEPDQPHNRFNDGKFGPDGRYWAGTMDDNESEASGSFYAFDMRGQSERVDSGYIVSNGPAFSPDGRTIYHTDSARRTVYAFDLAADGRLANRRAFIQFGEADGYPDGMTTDSAGNLWIAMWDGARLQQVSPAGERLGQVAMPTARPTSCVFVNERTLFVTSASIGRPETDTLAGGLFRVALR
jgi:sugar lactone lactonase YvrE